MKTKLKIPLTRRFAFLRHYSKEAAEYFDKDIHYHGDQSKLKLAQLARRYFGYSQKTSSSDILGPLSAVWFRIKRFDKDITDETRV